MRTPANTWRRSTAQSVKRHVAKRTAATGPERSTQIRFYLGTEADLPADPLLKRAGATKEKHPMIRLELRDGESYCVVQMRPGHFAFLENWIQAVRRVQDGLVAPGPSALPATGSDEVDGIIGEHAAEAASG